MYLLISILCALGLLFNGENPNQQDLFDLQIQHQDSIQEYYNANEEIHDDTDWS